MLEHVKKKSFIFIILIYYLLGCINDPNGLDNPKARWLTYSGPGIIVLNLDTQESDTFARGGDSITIPPNSLGQPYIRLFTSSPCWSPDGK